MSRFEMIDGYEHEVTIAAVATCNDCGATATGATAYGAARLIKHGKHRDQIARAKRYAARGY